MSQHLRWSAFVALVLVAACSPSDEPTPLPPIAPSSPRPTSPSAAPEARSLLYLDGRDLHRFDLAGARDEVLTEAPSVDATAAADGSRIAYVVDAATAPGHEDFVVAPEIQIAEVDSGELVPAGPGFSPRWSSDGDLLAVLVPAEERDCEGETCAGLVEVVIIDPVTGDRTTVLDPSRSSLLGWWGRRLLVAAQDPPEVLAVSLSGDTDSLGYLPSEVWGPAPDGRSLLVVQEGRVEFVPADPSEAARAVRLKGLVLGEGAWSPDSGAVAAVGLRGPRSALVLLRPGGSMETVRGSSGAQGQVVWAPDSASLVYARAAGPRGLGLQARFCADPYRTGCRSLFSWARGVRLLALVP